MKRLEPKRLLEGGGSGEDVEAMRALLANAGAPELPPAVQGAMFERVFRAVEARREGRAPRRPLLRWAAVGAVVSVAAAVVLTLRLHAGAVAPAAGPSADARALSATLEPLATLESGPLRAADGQGLPLAVGSALGGGSLRTDATHRALLKLARGGRLVVQPASHVSLESRGGQTVAHLLEGSLVAQADSAGLRVEAGGASASARESLFAMRASSAGAQLYVDRGAVEIAFGGIATRASPGRAWSSRAPALLSEPSRAAADEAIPTADRALLGEPADERPAAPRAAPRDPAAADVPRAGAPGRELRGADEAAAAPREDARAASEPRSVRAPDAPLAAAPEPASAPLPAIASPSPAVPGTLLARAAAAGAADPYRAAEQLLARGQYSEAARAFEQIVAQRGAHSDLALYELGRVRQRNLHDNAGALEALRRYRSDFPSGALAQEVTVSLIETELASRSASERSAALDEISGYLRANPSSERAAEMHLLRGNLLRERDECEQAMADYREAGRGASAGDALYFTAFCERRLGRVDEAKSALRDYLARFPSGEHRADASAALDAAGR